MVIKHIDGYTKAPPEPSNLRILRHAKVREKLDVSDATLFDITAQGLFPKPFQIIPGGRAVGWLEHEVDAWILERKELSGGSSK